MAENPKGLTAFVIVCLLVVYWASYVARRRTRSRGPCLEGCAVTLILLLAFIVVPAFLSAQMAARAHSHR